MASSRITKARLFYGADVGEDSFGLWIYRGYLKRLYKTDTSCLSGLKKYKVYERYKNYLWKIDRLLYLQSEL